MKLSTKIIIGATAVVAASAAVIIAIVNDSGIVAVDDEFDGLLYGQREKKNKK